MSKRQQKLEKHETNVYLVNTGWSGGAHGVGERMKLKDTRSCIDSILDGTIENSEFIVDPVFGFEVPTTLGNISSDVLVPRNSWSDKSEYDATAAKLASMFQDNFKKFVG